VLIGIAVKGKAVAGVIYQPYYNYQAGPSAALGRVIWGVVGLGMFTANKSEQCTVIKNITSSLMFCSYSCCWYLTILPDILLDKLACCQKLLCL
jgi:fructose-1,6-bisphosphatase/inositol monophosphatase family enzyme